MQYIVKDLMVSLSNVVLGAFMGMLIHIAYVMMNGTEQSILGLVGFFGGIVACIVYCVLLKKFVMGDELSITIPAIFMAVGLWIGWNCSVYV